VIKKKDYEERKHKKESEKTAFIETGRSQNRQMAFVLDSGKNISIGDGYMSKDGFYQAANAINNFLASGAEKRTTDPSSATEPSTPD
jgi:hypothetical protein